MNRDFSIYRLETHRVPELLAIQAEVCRTLPVPESLYPASEHEIEEFLSTDGRCFVAEHEGKLVGWLGTLRRGDGDGHVGRDLGVSYTDLPRVAYIKICSILPEYRGHRLQHTFFNMALEDLGMELIDNPEVVPAATNFKWATSTASPYAVASVKSLLSVGLCIGGLVPRYNNALRYLMIRHRNITHHDYSNAIKVPILDFKTQQELLKQGKMGVRLEGDRNNTSIIYV